MRDFIVTSLGASSAVGESGCKPTFETKEANVENITVLDVMNATSNDTVAKLVKIWENKNAQRALRGAGLSTMALSLAACGGSSTPAVEEPAPVEPEVTPVALVLTTDNDLFDANDFTTAADTITGDQDTYEAADVIAEATAGDGDTLTVTTDADIEATPTVVGIENIVVNVAAFATAGNTDNDLAGAATDGTDLHFDADGITGATITVNVTQLASTVDRAVVVNTNSGTVVAGTDVATLEVRMNEDAGTIVDAGAATVVNVASIAGDDQVANITVNGNVTVNAYDVAGTLTDLNITATAASEVTVNDNANLDTITGDANTTIVGGTDIADFDGFTITGAAGVQGAANTADLTGVAAAIAVTDNGAAVLTVAEGASVEMEVVGGSLELVAADDDDATTDVDQAVSVTLSDDTTGAGDYDITLTNSADDGSNEIITLNVVATGDIAGAAGALAIDTTDNTRDMTINLSGAGDVDMAATTAAGGDVTLNAAALAGALTVTSTAEMLTITGGSGDDTITALTNTAFALVGGDGNDTLVTDALMQSGTFSGFEILTINDGDDFLASQLSGYTAVVTTIGGSIEVLDASDIDIAVINMSGLTAQDDTDDIDIDLGQIDAAVLLAGQAITYTGWNGVDTVAAGANGDTISTGAGEDVITGGAGADTIDGGAGADEITGGAGADTLTGGAGADIFVLTSKATTDTITDYTVADDTIQISTAAIDNTAGDALAALGADADGVAGSEVATAAELLIVDTAADLTGGTLAAATDAEAFIYITDTGALYLNDSNAAGVDELILQLDAGTALVLADVVFIA